MKSEISTYDTAYRGGSIEFTRTYTPLQDEVVPAVSIKLQGPHVWNVCNIPAIHRDKFRAQVRTTVYS
jgi:hypothetical protein